MRSRNIELKVQKLKPRTRFYGFFDGIKIPQKLMTPKIMGVVKDPNTDNKTNNILSKLVRLLLVGLTNHETYI